MGFVEIARFASHAEAENAGRLLEPYDIPYMIKSDEDGSPVRYGASLSVPAEQADEVTRLLSGVVKTRPFHS